MFFSQMAIHSMFTLNNQLQFVLILLASPYSNKITLASPGREVESGERGEDWNGKWFKGTVVTLIGHRKWIISRCSPHYHRYHSNYTILWINLTMNLAVSNLNSPRNCVKLQHLSVFKHFKRSDSFCPQEKSVGWVSFKSPSEVLRLKLDGKRSMLQCETPMRTAKIK